VFPRPCFQNGQIRAGHLILLFVPLLKVS
jgi:hypothetical protein